MQVNQKLELNGKQLVPRELTVREIETVMEGLMTEEVHPLESVCPEEPIPAAALALSVGVEADDLKELVPSLVPELFRQVREKNPFLAQAVENLADLARRIPAEDSTISAAQSAD